MPSLQERDQYFAWRVRYLLSATQELVRVFLGLLTARLMNSSPQRGDY
jgi:hypothetical protein